MGRLLTFMGRVMVDAATPPATIVRGVAVDEKTALLLDTRTGDVQTVGFGTAYVCLATSKPEVCVPETPYTHTGADHVLRSPKL